MDGNGSGIVLTWTEQELWLQPGNLKNILEAVYDGIYICALPVPVCR